MIHSGYHEYWDAALVRGRALARMAEFAAALAPLRLAFSHVGLSAMRAAAQIEDSMRAIERSLATSRQELAALSRAAAHPRKAFR